jgi:predicted RND superfamily exporter protein
MEALPGVGKAHSIVDTLKHLNGALLGEQPGRTLPNSKALAAQVLLLYSTAGGNALSPQITPDNRIAKVAVLLRDDSTRYGAERMADARAILAEELPSGFQARIAGTLASNEALTDVMVRGKLTNILQIGAVAVVVASLLLRSLIAGLLVAVPLALAVAVDFGVMGMLGMPLDVVTAPFAALSVGIGADYAVYFLFRLREEAARHEDFATALRETYFTSGKAIVFVASAITAGYLALCVSGFSVHVRLSALVGLAMLASSVGSLTVLPALASLLARSRWRHTLLGRRLEPPRHAA